MHKLPSCLLLHLFLIVALKIWLYSLCHWTYVANKTISISNILKLLQLNTFKTNLFHKFKSDLFSYGSLCKTWIVPPPYRYWFIFNYIYLFILFSAFTFLRNATPLTVVDGFWWNLVNILPGFLAFQKLLIWAYMATFIFPFKSFGGEHAVLMYTV